MQRTKAVPECVTHTASGNRSLVEQEGVIFMHWESQTIFFVMVIIGLVCLVIGMILGASLARPRQAFGQPLQARGGAI
jgi:hypothetical protein